MRSLNENRAFIESFESHAASVVNSLETSFPNAVSQIGDTASGLETEIPAVVSQVRSAANAVATAVPAAIEAIVPRNCSIGATQFCIGLAHNVSCYPLPPDISGMIPSEIRNKLGEELESIQIFETAFRTALTKITPTTFRTVWIAGFVLIFLILASSLFSIHGFVLLNHRMLRITCHLVVGLIFCIPFIVLVVILRILLSKARALPSWIQVVEGELLGLFIGGLCCAVTLVAACVGLLIKY
jgi:hypothetical protein